VFHFSKQTLNLLFSGIRLSYTTPRLLKPTTKYLFQVWLDNELLLSLLLLLNDSNRLITAIASNESKCKELEEELASDKQIQSLQKEHVELQQILHDFDDYSGL
jgi:hypothetical protein